MNKASVYSRNRVGNGDSSKVSDNGPHSPHSVENYGAQASNSLGDKTPPKVTMEMNKRTSGEIPESGK